LLWAHQLATCAELPNPLINHPWQAWCWFCVASFYSSTLMLPSRTSFRAEPNTTHQDPLIGPWCRRSYQHPASAGPTQPTGRRGKAP
jgi:hypothetical protein